MEDALVEFRGPSGGDDDGGAASDPGVQSSNAEDDDDAVPDESRMSLDIANGGEGCGVDGEPPLWGADSFAEPEVFGADFVRSLTIQGKVWLDNTFIHIVASDHQHHFPDGFAFFTHLPT